VTKFFEGDENIVEESLHFQAVLLDKSDEFVKVTKNCSILFCPIRYLLYMLINRWYAYKKERNKQFGQ